MLSNSYELRKSTFPAFSTPSLAARGDMARQKKKLSPAQKAAKKKRQKEYMTIFVHGKQKRVKRPVTIDGMDIDEFIRRNADPIWLHQNELWEYMDLTDDDDPFPSNEFDEKGGNED
jgi:hypothetical protein